jgi:hypothetical protein
VNLIDRDKRILADLDRFRCMSRDDIAALHFAGIRYATVEVNRVMRRLRAKGYVKVDATRNSYVYMPKDARIREGSQKIDHFIGILRVYRDLQAYGNLQRFIVEPKYGAKGTVEPDIFAIWNRSPWFIEVQRSNYTDTVMRRKLARYERYRQSGAWHNLDWQPNGKPIFPHIWIIGKRRYANVNAYQSDDVRDFIQNVAQRATN